MESVRDVAQIIYYITLSVAGPLALIEFFRSRNAEIVKGSEAGNDGLA